MISAHAALDRLRQGNRRFVTGEGVREIEFEHSRRKALVDTQNPFAIILGCSDSRVPAELVFDQGLGDLFVIRVAGNIVRSSQIGSVEFAAEKFGTGLVVVLGHSRCGAVQATVEELQRPSADQSPHLKAIVDRIRPAVGRIVADNPEDDAGTLVEKAVRANVLHAAEALRHGSDIIEGRVNDEALRIVGAEYSLETGLVEFFEI